MSWLILVGAILFVYNIRSYIRKRDLNKYFRKIGLPLITAAIWGAAFLAQGNLGEILPPFFINFARSIIAVISLFIIDFIVTAYKKRKNKPIQKVDFKKLALGGVCCGVSLFGAMNVQQIGINGATTGEAAFITTLYMVLVPVVGVFLKKKVGVNVWISVVIALIGLGLICQIQTLHVNVSYLYLIACAVFFTVQILFIDYFAQYVDGMKLCAAQFLVAGVLSGILSLCVENGKVDFSRFSEAIFPLLYVGVFSSAIGYTLQIVAQRGEDGAIVSLLLSMEAAFALLFGVLSCLISGKPIEETPLQFLGCFLMLSAVVISQIDPFKKRKSQENKEENQKITKS